MTPAQSYTDLIQRLRSLETRRAVLKAKEADKAAQRAKLEQELQAAGIDTTQAETEKLRLQQEIDTLFSEAKRQVDEFEQALNKIEEKH